MNLLSVILKQGGNGGGSGDENMSLIFLAVIIVVFWLFFIRPQTKKNKELKKFRENLEKGQRIVTVGGIHGKILSVEDNIVTIEVEDGNKLKVAKSAISNEYKDEGEISQKK